MHEKEVVWNIISSSASGGRLLSCFGPCPFSGGAGSTISTRLEHSDLELEVNMTFGAGTRQTSYNFKAIYCPLLLSYLHNFTELLSPQGSYENLLYLF